MVIIMFEVPEVRKVPGVIWIIILAHSKLQITSNFLLLLTKQK
jgi:hypothetical protein